MPQYKEGDPSVAETAAGEKYDTFDRLLEQYENGEFGEQGPEAWAVMMQRWSSRTRVVLETGATALTGAHETGETTIADDIAAIEESRAQRLVKELMGDIDALGSTE